MNIYGYWQIIFFFSEDIVDKILEKLSEEWDMLMLDLYDPEKREISNTMILTRFSLSMHGQ